MKRNIFSTSVELDSRNCLSVCLSVCPAAFYSQTTQENDFIPHILVSYDSEKVLRPK